jgi:ribose-phosphate pyrophosphokinase
MKSNAIKVFSGRSNLPLAHKICEFLGFPLGNATVDSFPDGESFVQIHEHIRGADVFIVQSACCPANHNIMELLIMIDAAKRASADRITAVMPFYGYARQDRKDRPRVPITSKLVANLLVAAGANRILTVDLHAPQITGFFDIPIDHLFAAPVFYNYLQKLDFTERVVFSPDVGGMKMAAAYADMFGCRMGMIAKRRLGAEHVEALSIIGEAEGRNVLLVDDMTESAGTLLAAAKLLKENGALTVRAAVSHGVLNETGYERLKATRLIDEIITTDSTPVDARGLAITVLSIAELLGEAILRIHNNQSISSLLTLL